jgi:hypothetical protein
LATTPVVIPVIVIVVLPVIRQVPWPDQLGMHCVGGDLHAEHAIKISTGCDQSRHDRL